MRLTTVILIASLLQVSAATFGQRITINQNNVSLKAVLKEIRKQSGYDFFYDGKAIPNSQQVTVSVNNATIDETLSSVFKGLPFTYEVSDKNVTIKRKEEPSFFERVSARFQAIDVRGKVVDQNNAPLAGATIKIKGSMVGATSDTKGEFILKGVEEGAELEISFIGFAPINVVAKRDLGIVRMNEINSKLDEVIVQAYGTTTQRFSTSNIGMIKAEDIAKQPVSNPLLALQGRVPGLFIKQSSGISASNVNIVIQGPNSILYGSDPLYVIDGIPYNPQFLSQSLMGTAINGSGGSTFNFINPADIESVSVLKDADATAIYGSRAANGAILITTKKGQAGKLKVDVNMRNGWGKIVKKLDLMNTQEYLTMRKEAYLNAGQAVPTSSTAPVTSNFDLTVWDPNRYTDWQEELVGGTAQFTDLQSSLSGGTLNTQFLISYGYNRQTTVYPNSLADVKGNVHVNMNHNSNDSKFKYTFSASYLQDKNKLNGADLMSSIFLAPNAPTLYKEDGTLNWEPYPKDASRYSFTNPLAQTLIKYTGNTSNLIANNIMSYEVLNGLQFKIAAGYNRLQGDEVRTIPITTFKPDAFSKIRSASFLSKSIDSWIVEPQITLNKSLPYGVFELLIGSTFQQSKNDLIAQNATNYNNDAQLENPGSAPNITVNNVSKTLYKYNAIFGRLNYRLHDKYILNFSARRDGSSRFGASNKFNNFYGVGAAWLFADEPQIKTNIPFLSQGKLRISYGTTGNDQIEDYGYLSLLETYPTSIPYQGVTGLYPIRIANSYLQWEETRKLNFGVDLGLFKDKVNFNLNYFINRSSNQLLNYVLPYITGFNGFRQNFPATVQNSGFEGLVNMQVISDKNFSWQVSANITIPKNKLIAFKDLETSSYANDLVIGQPFRVRRVYKYAGVNSNTGLYEFYDSKGLKTSTPSALTDRTEFIDLNPKWYGGISNTFRFKGLDLDFLVQFVKQKAPNFRFGNQPGVAVRNQLTNFLDRWSNPGEVSDVQQISLKATTTATNSLAANSDAGFSGASYARLKNISLYYSIPTRLTNKVHITQLRVYLQGQNLLTVSKFIGSDPETLSIGSLPPLKMYTAGLQFTF